MPYFLHSHLLAFSFLLSSQGFVIELLLTLESGIDTLADSMKNYDFLTALSQ